MSDVNRSLSWLVNLVFSTVFLLHFDRSSQDHTLSIAGSTTVLPVVSKAAERYMRNDQDASIVVNTGGSGPGINLLGEGEIDIGMSSRALTPGEKRRYGGVEFNKHVIGLDAVLPVVSDDVYESGVRSLTRSELAGIYRGDIENWSEVEGPDRAIFVVSSCTVAASSYRSRTACSRSSF